MTPAAPRLDPVAPIRPVTGRTVLMWLLAFFAVIFAANAAFIYFALSSFPGLEVASSYRAGLDFADEMQQADNQARRGWQVNGHAERDGANAAVTATFADRTSAPVRSLTVVAHFEHPTDRRHDREVTLTETAPGSYAGMVETVAAGQWMLVLDAFDGDERLFRSRNLILLK